MITAAAHIRKGALQPTPLKAKISEEELRRVEEELKEQLGAGDGVEEHSENDDDEMEQEAGTGGKEKDTNNEVKLALKAAAKMGVRGGDLSGVGANIKLVPAEAGSQQTMDGMLAELHLDDYDTDTDDDENAVNRTMGQSEVLGGLMYVGGDPYMQEGSGGDDEKEDGEWGYNPEDVIFVATKSKDDTGTMEVWVYEEADDTSGGNLLVHHDIVLPSFPLCLALMDIRPEGEGDKACTVAVGSMMPGIEIWDLDILDSVEPICSLHDETAKPKKDPEKSATMALSWNSQFRNVLGSGGGDKRVRVWDVVKQKCKHKLKHHSKEVQCLAWNPAEASVLASSSFDKTACLVDVRTPNGEPLRWSLSGEAEAFTWSPGNPTSFLSSTDDGVVHCFDARKGGGSEPVFRLAAHEKPTTVLSFSPLAPDLLMTASIDKTVKIWDIGGGAPSLVVEKNVGAGSIFTGGFCGGSAPYLIYVGGDVGDVVIWDTRASVPVTKKYGDAVRVPQIFTEEEGANAE
ncbi:hypothetical protein BSKO_02989 [Bryopsis sp. KO-2023]|nr:hypothetical protein BSKO_02989 [Bryopsis sp. KO-2023]